MSTSERGQAHHHFGKPGGRLQALSGSGRTFSHSGIEDMRDSARYAKIVEWSEEDQSYVGSAPGLICAGCHGKDGKAVLEELCQVVEEATELYRKNGKPLPRRLLEVTMPTDCRASHNPVVELRRRVLVQTLTSFVLP